SLRVGDVLRISPPRNNFPVNETARHSLFIAGGIGITPIWSMLQRLLETGASWELVYCARTHAQTAFLAELTKVQERFPSAVRFNFDGEPGGQILDIARLVADAAPDTDFYCCGPQSMLAAFEKATVSLPPEKVHIEYFQTKELPPVAGGFTVVLERSG